jgi:hypothetical protein
MSITTYAELQTAVADWLHRTDLTTKIPDFIALAESAMSARIKCRSMEARSTLTCTASSAYVTLPTDMIEMRRLTLSSTTPARQLKYVTPDEITSDYPYGTTGEPYVFTVIAGQVQLAPIPDSAYTLELTYLQRIPALSDSNTTNWLLTAYPTVYLYGSLLQAQPYMADDARLPVLSQLYKDGVDAINSIDWYSGSTMAVRSS